MNWTKVLGTGVVAGIVVNLVYWVLHGFVMGNTYRSYPDVFAQEEASPVWFFVVSISVGIFFTILFAKTRKSWADGVGGGVAFGFWVGMVAFFSYFYDPLVIDGFPYFLAWCQGGITLIGSLVGGAVAGLMIKSVARGGRRAAGTRERPGP